MSDIANGNGARNGILFKSGAHLETMGKIRAIAFDKTGTLTTRRDVALETADVVLIADRLEKLSQAIRLGRRSQSIIKQNLAFALSFIILLLFANFTSNYHAFRSNWA